MTEPLFIDFGSRASFELAPGVRARPLFGEKVMMNLLVFEPNAGVPTHSHPQEQVGIVLRGVQILTIDGVEHALGEMEGYVLPSGLPHAGRAGAEGALVLDVFHPVRDDYRQRWEAVTAGAPDMSQES